MNDQQTQVEINERVARALGDAMIRNIALQVQVEALLASKTNGASRGAEDGRTNTTEEARQ